MKTCESCKHWIQMKELEGKCVLYGLKHCAWTPAEATCDEWEEDDDDCDIISRADAIEAIQNAYCKPCKERGDDYNEVRCRACEYDNAIIQIDALPSADITDTEECQKCQETTERVLLNKASAEADRPTGEWKGYNADNPNWLRKDGTPIFLVCDKCHNMVLNNSSTNWNYCPNCGARMKGGAE